MDPQGISWYRIAVEVPGPPKKQLVLRHGIVHTSPRKDEPVDASEGGDHDHNGDDDPPQAGKDLFRRGHGHPAVRGEGNILHAEYGYVHQVGADINNTHDQRAENEAQADIALGALDLSRYEGDVVPGVTAEQGSHHGGGHGAQAHHEPNRLPNPRAGIVLPELPPFLPVGVPDAATSG